MDEDKPVEAPASANHPTLSEPSRRGEGFARRFLTALWPPYALRINRISPPSLSDLHEEVEAEVRSHLDRINEEAVLEHARRAYENEERRRKSLDDKATTFTALAGTTLALVSTSAVLLRLRPDLSPLIRWALVVTYALTAAHFVAAAYYAFEVRRVAGFAQPTAVEIRRGLRSFPTRRHWIAWHLAAAEFNTALLLRKSNRLAVTERLAKRGFVLLTAVILLTLAAVGSASHAVVEQRAGEVERGGEAYGGEQDGCKGMPHPHRPSRVPPVKEVQPRADSTAVRPGEIPNASGDG